MCDAGVDKIKGVCVCGILPPKLYLYISSFRDVFLCWYVLCGA